MQFAYLHSHPGDGKFGENLELVSEVTREGVECQRAQRGCLRKKSTSMKWM